VEKKDIKVLIVEDSPSDAELLMEKIREFKNRHCQTKLATRMKDAENILEKENFDAIFLDLSLPDCNGLDTVKRVNEKRKDAPVIIMSGINEQGLIASALNLGMQNFIIKGEETPVSLERAIMFSIERQKNIREIIRSKKMQEEIIKNAPIMMFVVDSNRAILQANPETEKFTSKSESEMNGKLVGDVFECVNKFKAEKGCGYSEKCGSCLIAESINEVFSTKQSIYKKEITHEVVRKGRLEELFLLLSAEKMELSTGSGVLIGIEDMTPVKQAEKKLKESEKKFSNAFFSSPVGILITRAGDGKILECNNSLLKRFGFTREQLLGKTVLELGFFENTEARIKLIGKILKGEPVSGIETAFKNRYGETVPCLYSGALSEINGEKVIIASLFDLTEQKKIQAELKASEEQFEDSFEQAAVGIAFTALDGKFLKLNQRYCDIIGYTKEETHGMAFKDITYPENIEQEANAIKLLKTGEINVYKSEKRYIKKDKSLVWVDLTVSLAKDAGNNPKYFVAVIEDITAKKEAEDRWKAFSEAEKDILAIWDKNFKLVAANNTAREVCEAFTGIKLESGIAMQDLALKLNFSGDFSVIQKIINTGNTFEIDEVNIPNGSGGFNTYSVKVIPMASGIGLVVSDITGLKHAEMALKESFEKLQELDRLKSNFISIVSHELRTPLTVIKGFNTFLGRGAAGEMNERQKDYVNIIDQNITRLGNIINDMVDISRIERGTFAIRKETEDLAGVINEAIDSMHFIAGEKGINLEKNFALDSAEVQLDKGRMQQAITNIINNAIRFSQKGGKIDINLSRLEMEKIPVYIRKSLDEKKKYYFISVKDYGTGIEKEYLEKIFERFFQVENADTRRHPGSGLGLSIAQSVMEGHGGEIWAESEGLGKGTEICMVLPAQG